MKTKSDVPEDSRHLSRDTKNAASDDQSSSRGIELIGLRQEYNDTVAVDDVNLSIQAGELVTLLGSSGSGKSTILQMVAGLQTPARGKVMIAGMDVTSLAPQERNVGLVFQNYALFPHMNVVENIRFPLEMRKYEAPRRNQRVDDILRLIEMEALGGRLPAQLSGGQQQRVAIGRALAPTPRVLLLDEPLGALDKRLRQQLGHELRRIQQSTNITTIYVTHDQDEAFAISDRIAVIDGGRIRQVGTPEAIYKAPVDLFVASFVGEINTLPCRIVGIAGATATAEFPSGDVSSMRTSHSWRRGDEGVCVVRPEEVQVWDAGASAPPGVDEIGEADVVGQVFLGGSRQLRLRWHDVLLTIRTHPSRNPLVDGERVRFGWTAGHASVLPPRDHDQTASVETPTEREDAQ